MIPSKQTLTEWRRLAEDTGMRSALGEYTPDEFLVILTALERVVGVVEKVAAHCRLVLPKDAPGYWTAVLPPDVIAEVARATAEINGYGGDDDHG